MLRRLLGRLLPRGAVLGTDYARAVTALAANVTDAGFLPANCPSWIAAAIPYTNKNVEARALLAWDMQLRLSAQTGADVAHTLEVASGEAATSLTVLGIGDSITNGANSYDRLGYRGVLANLLRAQHIDTDGPVASGATSGFTLGDIAPSIPSILATYHPDIVLLNLGTNDAARPELANWQDRYGAAVDLILASGPNVKVACARVMISTPSWSTGEATVNAAVDAVVAARQIGGRVVAVDLTQLDAHVLAGADGVHPTSLGYALMAGIWYRAIWPWLP